MVVSVTVVLLALVIAFVGDDGVVGGGFGAAQEKQGAPQRTEQGESRGGSDITRANGSYISRPLHITPNSLSLI